MKKNDLVKVEITDMKFSNVGIGFLEGKKVSVKNGLPGQEVLVHLSKVRSKKAKGTIKEIIKQAPYEIEPRCIHYDECGGCSRQTVPYEEQLQLKEKLIERLFASRKISYHTKEAIVPSPIEYEYRNKMEYSFGDLEYGGQLNLGMHRKGRFYDVITTDACDICPQDYNKILSVVLKFARKTELAKYHIKTREGFYRHLTLRKGFKTGEILIGLSTTTQGSPDFTPLIEELLSLELEGTIVGFLNIKNDGFGDVVKGPYDILYGRDYFYEELLGLKFKISFYSFFQVNPLGAEKLYSRVREFLGDQKNKNVLELFSGTGTIGQVVASNAKRVYGVELIESAVEMANENTILNTIENCEFITGDVYKEVRNIDFPPDTIILDPPRYGIPKKSFKKILDFDVDEIIYVACNPHGLMDNLEEAIKAGYVVKKYQCVDMFPQTPHCEVIVKLDKNK